MAETAAAVIAAWRKLRFAATPCSRATLARRGRRGPWGSAEATRFDVRGFDAASGCCETPGRTLIAHGRQQSLLRELTGLEKDTRNFCLIWRPCPWLLIRNVARTSGGAVARDSADDGEGASAASGCGIRRSGCRIPTEGLVPVTQSRGESVVRSVAPTHR